MNGRRWLQWAMTSTRVLVGIGAAVGIALVAAFAVAADWPSRPHRPATVTATPTAADTVLSCPGGLLALGRDATNAAGLSTAAPQTLTSSGDGTRTPLRTIPDVPGADVLSVTARAGTSGAGELAASGSTAVAADDLRGFAASGCRAPAMESWLVGGAGTTGASDLILLANPGEVPAVADLTVFGASGALRPPGGQDLVIPPGVQRVVPLAGLAVGEEAPVVLVTATGAPVTATLQAALTRTLAPGGVDQVTPVTPDTAAVVPGVTVAPSAAAETEATTVVRLLSPGRDDSATVSVVGAGGDQVLTHQVPLTADVPTQLELAGLPAGSHTVSVTSSAPVVSAVWQATGLGAGSDFAWYAPAPRLDADALVVVPEGAGSAVAVASAATGPVEVRLDPVGPGGATGSTATVAPGHAVTLPAPAGAYWLRVDGPVHAEVVFAADGALAAFPVIPVAADASAVTVHP